MRVLVIMRRIQRALLPSRRGDRRHAGVLGNSARRKPTLFRRSSAAPHEASDAAVARSLGGTRAAETPKREGEESRAAQQRMPRWRTRCICCMLQLVRAGGKVCRTAASFGLGLQASDAWRHGPPSPAMSLLRLVLTSCGVGIPMRAVPWAPIGGRRFLSTAGGRGSASLCSDGLAGGGCGSSGNAIVPRSMELGLWRFIEQLRGSSVTGIAHGLPEVIRIPAL